MQPDPALGLVIRRARERRRMTQQQLADAAGVSLRTVSNWELGHHVPRNRTGVLEDILGISLGGEPQAPAIVPEYEWERLLLLDETLPYAERVQIIEVTRRARAEGAPAPVPRPAGGAREPRAPGSRAV